MKCQDCKFWCRFKGSKDKGECRKWSPEVLADHFLLGVNVGFKTVWPRTDCDDWCGQFESKDKPQETKQ